MTAEPWVTAEQVAQRLGGAKGTVCRWRERKGTPAPQDWSTVEIPLSEVT